MPVERAIRGDAPFIRGVSEGARRDSVTISAR